MGMLNCCCGSDLAPFDDEEDTVENPPAAWSLPTPAAAAAATERGWEGDLYKLLIHKVAAARHCCVCEGSGGGNLAWTQVNWNKVTAGPRAAAGAAGLVHLLRPLFSRPLTIWALHHKAGGAEETYSRCVTI